MTSELNIFHNCLGLRGLCSVGRSLEKTEMVIGDGLSGLGGLLRDKAVWQ